LEGSGIKKLSNRDEGRVDGMGKNQNVECERVPFVVELSIDACMCKIFLVRTISDDETSVLSGLPSLNV
jgi:hypothetical protein